ncbi:MAG: NAD-dependent epimerase/dehydratase family protein [Anaerolineae bacterium]|nr:NAD-dependent epimerase/dehydratase family protein [Gemmatimonadaceae bacterium]
MRILVIGGNGFIGRFLMPRLVQPGHEVAVLQRASSQRPRIPGATEILGDRNDLASVAPPLRAFAPDVVIDLILSSERQARTLMQVFRGVAGHVVAISSIDVYRACGVLHGLEEGPLEPVPLREESALRTKLQTYPPEQIRTLQQIFHWLDDDYDKIPVEAAVLGDPTLPASVLRLPMIYGPGDRLHRFHGMIKRMHDNRPAIIMQESWAAWRSPRGYVENVAATIALAATSGGKANRVFNVAESESLSELEWARRIADVVGWGGYFIVMSDEETPAHLRIPGNLKQHWSVDTSRIRKELGYREPVEQTECILRTVEWELANPPTQVDASAFDYEAEDAVLGKTSGAYSA